jgi:hypothetical protein
LLFNLESVFFFFSILVFCFAIVVGSVLSLSSLSSLLPVVRAFEEGKKESFGRRRS